MSIVLLCTVLWWSVTSDAFIKTESELLTQTSNFLVKTEIQFQNFIKKHNKDYHPSSPEYSRRKSIFYDTIRRIEKLNKIRKHRDAAVYGITEFADLTPQEFHDLFVRRRTLNEDRHGGIRHKRDVEDFRNISGIPKRLDWRDAGIIGKVRNQDKCGACWAFSTAATIESMVALQTDELNQLSVQQMIDCSTVNKGCDGGDTCAVLEWLSNNDVALVTEEKYPFEDETDGFCKMKSNNGVKILPNFTCNNYTGAEEEILRLLAQHGPLTAAVDATGWQDYLGGIIQYHCETKRNHAVQIVGYDLSGDIPHYIIRNSWGTKFGDNGYLKIAIGNDLCAIAEEISAINVVIVEGEKEDEDDVVNNL